MYYLETFTTYGSISKQNIIWFSIFWNFIEMESYCIFQLAFFSRTILFPRYTYFDVWGHDLFMTILYIITVYNYCTHYLLTLKLVIFTWSKFHKWPHSVSIPYFLWSALEEGELGSSSPHFPGSFAVVTLHGILILHITIILLSVISILLSSLM